MLKILGEGCNAIRIYRDAIGCEVRAASMIINCNEDMAQVIDLITEKDISSNEVLVKLEKITGEKSVTKNIEMINGIITNFESIGISKDVWGKELVENLTRGPLYGEV